MTNLIPSRMYANGLGKSREHGFTYSRSFAPFAAILFFVKFEFFDHTADLGANIHGATHEELFQNAAAALYHALGEFKLKPDRTAHYIRLKSNSMEELLVEFAGELLFLFDAHRLLFEKIEIEVRDIVIKELQHSYLLAKLTGGEVDLPRSEPNYEIKAVTYHHARIEKAESGWKATLIFDV